MGTLESKEYLKGIEERRTVGQGSSWYVCDFGIEKGGERVIEIGYMRPFKLNKSHH